MRLVRRKEGPPPIGGGAGLADEEDEDEGRAYRGERGWLDDCWLLRPRKAASMAKADVFATLSRRSVDEEIVAAIKSYVG